MKFAISVLASKTIIDETNKWRQNQYNCHVVGVVEAGSPYEAQGKAYAIALKRFPVAESWVNHNVSVCGTDDVSDPDGQIVPFAIPG